jgi:hypothetical protein
MIGVKDLRIGNIVFVHTEHLNENYDDSNYIFVEEIFYDGINRTLGDSTMYLENQLQPVALTTALLKVAGFNFQNDAELSGYCSPYFAGMNRIIVYEKDGRILYTQNQNLSIEIKSMHQLQNLFYVLSEGDELAVDLEDLQEAIEGEL